MYTKCKAYLLKEAYVYSSTKQFLTLAITTSFITFIVLFVLKAFEVGLLPLKWRFVSSLIYATIPFMEYPLLVRYYKNVVSKKAYFSRFHEYCTYLSLFVLGGFLIFLYSYLLFGILFTDLLVVEWDGFFLRCFGYSFSVGFLVFPIYGVLNLFYFHRDNRFKGKAKQKKDEVIVLKGNSKNGLVLSLNKTDILFFESNKNNISIHVLEEKSTKVYTIRKTLKEIHDQLSKVNHGFFMCHRSFIINMGHIKRISGNSRTSFAVLTNDIHIPIARSKLTSLKASMEAS